MERYDFEKMNKSELIALLRLKGLEAKEPEPGIKFPQDMTVRMSKYMNRKQEHFVVYTLDGAHRVINERVITKGLVNRTITHPREVFQQAIKDNAVAIIIGHNHPSGSVQPSQEDKDLTTRMKNAGELLGISVLDHIIIGKQAEHFSFLEKGLL